MSENKKADDFSVDDIIKDVMRKKRKNESGNSAASSNVRSDDIINVKRSEIKTEDISSRDYFKSFYDDNKTSNAAFKKSNMNQTKIDEDALKTQEKYMKKNLDELRGSNSEEEASITELFANAVKKSGKKLSPAQQAAIKEARMTKSEKSAENSIKKINKPVTHEPAKPDEWRTDGIPLSDLVAGAMQARKNTKTSISDISEPVRDSGVVYSDTDDVRIKPKRRKWSVKKKASVILCYVFGIIFLLCGTGISVFAFYTGMLDRDNEIINIIDPGQSEIGSNDTVDAVDYEKMLKDKLAKSAANVVSDSDVTNILLVGEDLRDTVDNTSNSNGNTDVIMMISINTARGTVTTTSFMRDIYLQIPGYYATRINAAYMMGGIPLLEQTIQDNFSIKIDKYLKVNFYSFIDIVDTMGGLDIKISKEEAIGMRAPLGEQNKYLGKKYGTDYIKKGGTIHMNGNQALAYARLRKVGNSDWERTQRQRTVIDLIANKTKELSLTELNSLLNKVLGKISTDLSDAEIAYYLLNASAYLNYERDQIQIPAEGTYTCEKIRDADVLCPDFTSNIRTLQKKIYGYSKIKDDETDNYSAENSYGNTSDTNGYYDSTDAYNSYDSGYAESNANTFY